MCAAFSQNVLTPARKKQVTEVFDKFNKGNLLALLFVSVSVKRLISCLCCLASWPPVDF